MTEIDMEVLVASLHTLNKIVPMHDELVQAEKTLNQMKTNPNFPNALLQVFSLPQATSNESHK